MICNIVGAWEYTMEISESVDEKINTAFVVGLVVVIVVFWFLIIPSA